MYTFSLCCTAQQKRIQSIINNKIPTESQTESTKESPTPTTPTSSPNPTLLQSLQSNTSKRYLLEAAVVAECDGISPSYT